MTSRAARGKGGMKRAAPPDDVIEQNNVRLLPIFSNFDNYFNLFSRLRNNGGEAI
jgi:hypothetical protein